MLRPPSRGCASVLMGRVSDSIEGAAGTALPCTYSFDKIVLVISSQVVQVWTYCSSVPVLVTMVVWGAEAVSKNSSVGLGIVVTGRS